MNSSITALAVSITALVLTLRPVCKNRMSSTSYLWCYSELAHSKRKHPTYRPKQDVFVRIAHFGMPLTVLFRCPDTKA